MTEIVFTTVISALTPLITSILPLLAAATGRNALKADMDLYRQWDETLHANQAAVPQGTDDLADSEEALRVFRASIDCRLRQRARRGGRDAYVYGGLLIALLALYVVSMVVFDKDGLVDDLLRALAYFAACLIVITVFELRRIRQVNESLRSDLESMHVTDSHETQPTG